MRAALTRRSLVTALGLAGLGAASSACTSSFGQASAAPPAQAAPAAATPVVTAERLPQPEVVAPLPRRAPITVPIELETREVMGAIDEGVAYSFWTFDGTVPGPFVRVRQGDTVEVTLRNASDSKAQHNIDFHAATGPGGGAKVSTIGPGQTAKFSFKALNVGLYVYHCAIPPVAMHVACGMYGMIFVEPPEGLPPVDHEYYVMQGDFYLEGKRGDTGLRAFSYDKLLDERPDYVVFNGGVGALTGERALKAKVGDTVRIFFGVGGPNLTSSFHVIGEIFDRVYQQAASEISTNVQTTLVPAGGATIVEFKCEVPGTFLLVDHSLGRLDKGAAGHLVVEGPENPTIFRSISMPEGSAAMSGH